MLLYAIGLVILIFPFLLVTMYSFETSQIKLKLGQQFGGGLLIANHLDQLL
jgi:ABC-type spermidine/putrescine transport system permease subunit II